MESWTRYGASVGRGYGQWDIDSGVTHSAEHGMTLCGYETRGERWERTPSMRVSCKRCLKKLAAMPWLA